MLLKFMTKNCLPKIDIMALDSTKPMIPLSKKDYKNPKSPRDIFSVVHDTGESDSVVSMHGTSEFFSTKSKLKPYSKIGRSNGLES